MWFLGENFFIKKFSPNPFQKILNYMERCKLHSRFGILKSASNFVNPSRLKVFEKGFGEKLFLKSFSPISPITY